ncbi:hypothetical protein, partial [Dysosmobacter sp.]|uniref:hypothetical protein n=1 Tax=Dysosmobacter sp. TaxID=2591382 RepID=UPI002A8551CD
RPAPFSSTVHGAFFFGKTKKNGGCIPAGVPAISHAETGAKARDLHRTPATRTGAKPEIPRFRAQTRT